MKQANTQIQISELFEIKLTEYGGRACFARRNQQSGDIVLQLSQALGSSIAYEYRKEVCHFCFAYNGGALMKTTIGLAESKLEPSTASASSFRGGGLRFCSEICKEAYMQQDSVGELVEAFEALLQVFQRGNKRRDTDLQDDDCEDAVITEAVIEEQWRYITDEWIPKLSAMKPSRRQVMLPVIDDEVYSCARFVTECLFTLKHLPHESTMYHAFEHLQSNELQKITAFPVLLEFQLKVYKFLKVVLPSRLGDLLTPALFRKILGSEYGNSFGIWEQNEGNDSRAYLGYWVLPEASYFNHSCAPNLAKKRVGREIYFVLTSDVAAGEQLCIDYKGILDLPVVERRNILCSNWFFDCACERCTLELQSIH
ncbi:AaceriAAL097Cp [[Ashbya] aceris (nom. inval.)]|nr:AaceriAAL097Cp [[Ashbya] aceris (nom. inval.)]